jgi:hypothetical protein
LNVNATGGQSGAGAFTAGLAPVAAYSIQNMMNQNAGGQNQFPPGYNAGGGPAQLYGNNVTGLSTGGQ